MGWGNRWKGKWKLKKQGNGPTPKSKKISPLDTKKSRWDRACAKRVAYGQKSGGEPKLRLGLGRTTVKKGCQGVTKLRPGDGRAQ